MIANTMRNVEVSSVKGQAYLYDSVETGIALKTFAVNFTVHVFCVGMRRETGKVGLGPVFRPFMNSDQNRHFYFRSVFRRYRDKINPKYLFDLSTDLIVSAPNTDKKIRQKQTMYTSFKFTNTIMAETQIVSSICMVILSRARPDLVA